MERVKKEELYRSDIETDVVAKVRLETMMMPFNEEIFPKNKFSLATLQQQLIEYFFFGIASMKCKKLILKYHKSKASRQHIKINKQ